MLVWLAARRSDAADLGLHTALQAALYRIAAPRLTESESLRLALCAAGSIFRSPSSPTSSPKLIVP
jgi:hypothetical protein